MISLYPFVNAIAAYSVILAAILVWKNRASIRGAENILFFFFCVFGYLVIEDIDQIILKHVMLIGPLMLPFSFWLFSRSLFSDSPLSGKKLTTYFLVTVSAYYGLYILGLVGYTKVNLIVSHTFSLFFAILALKEALTGRHTDLDEQRIKVRSYFVYAIGVLLIITLMVEVGLSAGDHSYLKVTQRTIIVIINSAFIGLNFAIKSKLLSKRKKQTTVQYPQLIEKIQAVMVDDQLYLQEKLTIGQLAEKVNEQEYKVRRAINQDLGYRNFIDFINSYRIKAAIDLLKDPDKVALTILEIAYQTGFNSIGPFNRAFKLTTGYTPTDYRNQSR